MTKTMRTHSLLGGLSTFLAISLFTLLYFVPVWGVLYFLQIETLWVITVAHGSVVLVLLSQYFVGKRQALKAVDAEPLDNRYHHLIEAAENISEEFNLNNPTLYQGKFGSINAFVVGRKNKGSIVFSESMLNELNERDQKAVLAHELSHLRSHDTTLMMLGEGINTYLEGMKHELMRSMDDNIGSLILFKPLLLLVLIAKGSVLIPLRSVSRKREYRADRDAATVYGSQQIKNALHNVSYINGQIINPPKPTKKVDALCIDGLKSTFFQRLFGTHPPMEKRIGKLK